MWVFLQVVCVSFVFIVFLGIINQCCMLSSSAFYHERTYIFKWSIPVRFQKGMDPFLPTVILFNRYVFKTTVIFLQVTQRCYLYTKRIVQSKLIFRQNFPSFWLFSTNNQNDISEVVFKINSIDFIEDFHLIINLNSLITITRSKI